MCIRDRIGSLIVVAGIIWFLYQGTAKFDLNERQAERVSSFSDIFSGEFDEQDTGTRFVQAAIGVREWVKSPVFGHGLGTGGRMQTDYGTTLGTHNHFLLMLVETGIVGAIPYILFFVVATIAGLRCKDNVARTLAMGYLVAFFCHNMTGHNIPSENFHATMLGVTFGILSAASYKPVSYTHLTLPTICSV